MDARTGSMVLGLFGGMVGLAATMFAVAGGLVVWWGGALALVASIAGTVGAALAVRRPVVGAALMLAAGIAGLVGSRQFFVVAGPMFLVGGFIAFGGRRRDL